MVTNFIKNYLWGYHKYKTLQAFLILMICTFKVLSKKESFDNVEFDLKSIPLSHMIIFTLDGCDQPAWDNLLLSQLFDLLLPDRWHAPDGSLHHQQRPVHTQVGGPLEKKDLQHEIINQRIIYNIKSI